MYLRTLLAGTIAATLALTAPQVARAGELDEYLELSYEDGWSQITEHATELTDANVDEVLGYDGLVVVVSTPECLTDKGKEDLKYFQAAVLELMERYNGESDNRGFSPIKFAYFDSCDTNASNPRTVQKVSANGTDAIFWYGGQEFTRKEKAPLSANAAEKYLVAMDFLFRKNFTQFDGETFYLISPDGDIRSTPAKL
ncbi:hypothetical protein HOD38_05635 [archaeon]|jgi:hypothetical protein|nr:hypothetical protein [archaeon]MBT4397723.1 hypothetical protein [archaeon]